MPTVTLVNSQLPSTSMQHPQMPSKSSALELFGMTPTMPTIATPPNHDVGSGNNHGNESVAAAADLGKFILANDPPLHMLGRTTSSRI
mmetsp:Transcript_37050/g.68005  ORF Transcript_37050/g.68005 Transcript_37050/m.68005 type:complete len:88 (+) Transcript_37050:281-544(+)